MVTSKAAAIPAQYAKFVTALLGAVAGYLTAYGPVWNLQGALVMAGTALAVLGVPNGTTPAVQAPAARPVLPPTGSVTITPPDPGRPAGSL